MIVSWFRNGQVHTIITELTVKQNQEDFLSSTKHHMEPIPLSDWMDGNFFLYIYIYKKKKKKKKIKIIVIIILIIIIIIIIIIIMNNK